jgi:hypothetical protein
MPLSGYKWESPNVSVSFMPDGTLIGGVPSNLFALYDAKYERPVWQGEILRALQTWQDHSGLAFTLLQEQLDPETGTGYPNNVTPALAQGDPRFGDIRFGADPTMTLLGKAFFPTDTSAVGGNVTLNGASALNIGSSPDLYSVVLHELGGAIGLLEAFPDGIPCPGPSVMLGPGPYGLYRS